MSTIRLTHTICPYPQSGYNLFRDTRKVSKYLGNFLKKIITETFQNTRIWSHWWCDGSSARHGTARHGTARHGIQFQQLCAHIFWGINQTEVIRQILKIKWFLE